MTRNLGSVERLVRALVVAPVAILLALFVFGPGSALGVIALVVAFATLATLVTADLRQGGGALGRPAPSHGTMSSVPGSFDMFAAGAAMGSSQGAVVAEHLARVRAVFAPHAAGRAFTFVEEPGYATASFYPAATYERLQAVKRQFDPDGLIHANHEIPPS